MKPQYFLIHIFFVLVFGLISCKSENNQSPQPEFPQKPSTQEGIEGDDIRVENPDRTFNELNKLKEIKVGSHIQLKEKHLKKFKKINVISTCYSSRRNGFSSLEIQGLKVEEIAVMSLLPGELFTPNKKGRPSYYCDFNLEFVAKKSKDIVVDLKKVKIIGVEEYSNFHWNLITGKKMTYLRFSDLKQTHISYPMKTGLVKTVCEDEVSESYYNNTPLDRAEMFPDQLFDWSNLVRCRLHLSDDQGHKKWVSKSFYIQRTNPTVRVTSRKRTRSNHGIRYNREDLISFEIQNTSETDIFISAPPHKKSSIEIQPVYIAQKYLTSYIVPSTKFTSSWNVESPLRPGRSNIRNQKLFRLAPGDSLNVYLPISTHFKCPNELNGQFGGCDFPVLSGYHYIFSAPPQLRLSHFSDPKLDRWTEIKLNIKGARWVGSQLYLWAPHERINKSCSLLKPQKDPGFNLNYYLKPNNNVCK